MLRKQFKANFSVVAMAGARSKSRMTPFHSNQDVQLYPKIVCFLEGTLPQAAPFGVPVTAGRRGRHAMNGTRAGADDH
jgi:hypothetical protein